MEKRDFLKLSGVFSAGVFVSPLSACSRPSKTLMAYHDTTPGQGAAVFEQAPLPFDFNALEPHIDTQTMEIHYGKHHAAYVKNLNAALAGGGKFDGMNLNQIMVNVEKDDTAVRNNGGGHFNHDLFWDVLTPGGATKPSGKLMDKINTDLGSYEAFEKQFTDAAKSRFGSGWAWMNVGADGKLFVSSTANQDNPLMARIADKPGKPILGLDVWEHAYYLHYQNRRPDYISAFMGLINWDKVTARL